MHIFTLPDTETRKAWKRSGSKEWQNTSAASAIIASEVDFRSKEDACHSLPFNRRHMHQDEALGEKVVNNKKPLEFPCKTTCKTNQHHRMMESNRG